MSGVAIPLALVTGLLCGIYGYLFGHCDGRKCEQLRFRQPRDPRTGRFCRKSTTEEPTP